MIRVLDIPGVKAIEARYRLNAATASRQPDHELAHMLSDLISQGLGVDGSPTDLLWHHDYELALSTGDDQASAQAFANGHYIADEADNDDRTELEFWRSLGWDVAGEDGKELLCLGAIEDALTCVSEGLARRPMVEIEADLWRVKKEAEARADPQEQKRNRQFLDLGAPRRKRA